MSKTVTATSLPQLAQRVDALAGRWRLERAERQARRHLDPDDFAALREAGLLSLAAPVDTGGLFDRVSTSVRPACELYRTLAGADSSVALVSSMHPSVIAFWLACPDPSQPAWEEQRRAVFASAVEGVQWGTVTSEPGSGGDLARTRAKAVELAADGQPFLPGVTYAVTGDKHFGSGTGIVGHMVTTAVAAADSEPTVFAFDARHRPLDGTAGLRLISEWDGMGMAATQSHALKLEALPCVRMAWSGPFEVITRAAGPLIQCLFTAVVLGVVDEAVSVARGQVRNKQAELRAYEQVEWTRAEHEHWLAVQAYEGALRAVERDDPAALYHTLRAKEAVAELGERVLLRLTRVLGGGSFSRRSPFAHWFEDVRALGFLRPPWGLAYDGLFASSLS